MQVAISERLKNLRTERNMTLKQVAELTGIPRSTIGSYEVEDEKDINHRSLITLAKLYDVPVDHLLCLTENRKHSNAELTALHLSEKMVEMLKIKQVNDRLLCGIVTHEDFIKLMTDIEIYVDGINIIIDAIKKAYRSDRKSAPENPIIAEFKQNLEEVANCKGSRLEQLLILFCKQTQLKYIKLTDEGNCQKVRAY